MPRLEDVLIPEWDLLLIERETTGELVQRDGAAWIERPTAAGEELIVRPSTARDAGQSRVGKILRVGPDTPEVYRVGRRVVFGLYSGIEVKLEDAEGRSLGENRILLPRREVLAILDGEEEGEPMSLGWLRHAIPPPGKLLVERLDTPLARGRILLPDGVRTSTRANECEIVAVGEGVTYFEPGEFVYLSGQAPKMIPFGVREERKLHLVDPSAVGGRILAESAVEAPIYSETSPLRGSADLPGLPEDRRFDEGDQRLPQ